MDSLLPSTGWSYTAIFMPIVVLLLILNYFKSDKSQRKLPPGPRFALPLLGNLLQLGVKPHITFRKWRKKYGPLFSFKMASLDTIVVSDSKLTKELLAMGVTTGRPKTPFFDVFTNGGHGILFTDGKEWEELRAFAVRTMTELGIAKGKLEGIILDEVKSILDYLERRAGTVIQGRYMFNGAVVCSLWTLVSGERNEWIVDGELRDTMITKQCEEFVGALNEAGKNGLAYVCWLRHVAPEYLGWNRYVRAAKSFQDMAEETVVKHLENINKHSPRDLIDHFLIRIEETTDPASLFYKERGRKNLQAFLADFFLAGNETSATTLEYSMIFLSQNTQAQRKLQEELDSVVGHTRLANLSDRDSLPYTQAVIMETLRRSSLVAFTPHRITENFMFQGYLFPKDCVLFIDIHNVNHDTNCWGSDVEIFRPERFLNAEGTQIVSNEEGYIPFGSGKRRCLGEALGLDTVFLFLTCILQRFRVEAIPPGRTFGDEDVAAGLLLDPKPFEICFHLRNH